MFMHMKKFKDTYICRYKLYQLYVLSLELQYRLLMTYQAKEECKDCQSYPGQSATGNVDQ